MDHVRKATVRDLRYHFPEVESLLQEGEEVQITKRKRVIARLVPERAAATAALPDFMAMLKEIYGNKKLKVTGAELIRADRDRY
jgi:antitoxin (DNA-binding transcriptional repressor) of toxin-antitoxin stability system